LCIASSSPLLKLSLPSISLKALSPCTLTEYFPECLLSLGTTSFGSSKEKLSKISLSSVDSSSSREITFIFFYHLASTVRGISDSTWFYLSPANCSFSESSCSNES
jgi:hypothetical protein